MDSKDKEIVRVNENYDKAQERYNELTDKYVKLCSSVQEWKLAAKKGSEEVQAQNEILNSSLKKLSEECKVAQSRLATEIEKSKELEFELLTMTTQFNDANKNNERLKDVIQDYIKKHNELNGTYQESLKKINKLNKKIEELEHKIEITESEMIQEKRKAAIEISDLSKTLDDCKKEKEVVQLRMEEYLMSLEKMTLDYGKIMTEKCRLENELTFLKTKHKNVLAAKLKIIDNLEKKDHDLTIKLNEYTDENIRLQAVENELRYQLDQGNLNVNVLKFDLSQAQTTLEDLRTKLSDKISKLMTSNKDLKENNKILSSKVVNMKKKIEDDEKYISILKNKMEEYEEKNDIKNAIYNTHKIEMYIEEKIAEREEKNIQSIKKIENLNEQITIKEQSLQKSEEHRVQLEEENKKLKEEICTFKQEPVVVAEVKKEMNEKIIVYENKLLDLKTELEDKKRKHNDISQQFNNYKVTTEHEIEFYKSEKLRLQKRIDELTKEAEESQKVIDKIYESYENTKVTMDHLLLNNEMLKSELISKQNQIYTKKAEFEDFSQAQKVMERNYFTLVKLEKQEYNSIYNDILAIQVQLKQEAHRIDRVIESCSL